MKFQNACIVCIILAFLMLFSSCTTSNTNLPSEIVSISPSPTSSVESRSYVASARQASASLITHCTKLEAISSESSTYHSFKYIDAESANYACNPVLDPPLVDNIPNGSIMSLDLSTDESRLLTNAVLEEGQILQLTVLDGWLVWIEYEPFHDTDSTVYMQSMAPDWGIYAYELSTGKTVEIDRKDQSIIADSDAFFQYQPPYDIDGHGSRLVYSTYDYIDGALCAVIRLHDLSTGENRVLDFSPDYATNAYSSPHIYGDTVVWSWNSYDLSTYLETGYSYLYDLASGKKEQLSFDGETIWPDIWENYVIARVKPGGSNDLSYYRIMDLNEGRKWGVLTAPTDSIYSDSDHVELTSASFSDGYVSWWTNTREQYFIYSIENGIVYALPGCGDDYSHSGLECQNGGRIVFHIGCTDPMEIYYCDISKLE